MFIVPLSMQWVTLLLSPWWQHLLSIQHILQLWCPPPQKFFRLPNRRPYVLTVTYRKQMTMAPLPLGLPHWRRSTVSWRKWCMILATRSTSWDCSLGTHIYTILSHLDYCVTLFFFFIFINILVIQNTCGDILHGQ